MSLNLIDLIKGQLGPALISQAASQLGESESGISKAISGLLPAVVGGLANNADNPGVLNAITGASSSGILSNLLGNSTGNSLITTLLTSIFGDKLAGLVNSVAHFAGISNTSTNSLLNLVTGATLGSVGKYASDNNLDASGIKNLLGDQKGLLSSLLPAGLSLAALGLDTEKWFGKAKENVESVASTAKDNLAEKAAVAKEKIDVTRSEIKEDFHNAGNDGGGSVWKWLLPILLLALAAWFLWKQCDKKKTEAGTVTGDSVTITQDSSVVSDGTTTVTKVEQDIDLNGAKLKGYLGGMEDKMIAFLKGEGYKKATDDSALKDIWYDFDHVNFKMGSSTELEPGSETQLDNLVAILKAYPDAKIKIGGYTDKTGDETVNKKISTDRAKFILKWLSDKGVGSQVVSAEGYGSEFAKIPATASDAERATDRKMAVRFTK
ncbi:OmpA family protein [Weeksellaceae bacterium A-14]